MKNILSADIIKEWNLGALPEVRRVEMVERIGKIMYQALMVRSLDILTPKEHEEFDLLLDDDETTPDDALMFLKKKIPDFEKIMLEERRALKRDLLIEV